MFSAFGVDHGDDVSKGVQEAAQAAKESSQMATQIDLLTAKVAAAAAAQAKAEERLAQQGGAPTASALVLDVDRDLAVVMLHPGAVRTGLTGGHGMIDVDESARGLLRRIDEPPA